MKHYMDGFSLDRTADRKVRKIMGLSYLRAGRLEEALAIYASILRDNAQDVDVLFIFGNLYLLSGSSRTAEKLYAQILEMAPGNLLIERQLTVAREMSSDPTINGHEETDPFCPDALERLERRLSVVRQRHAESGEIFKAANMLQKSTSDTANSPLSGDSLAALDQLMPALIDLNIRLARAAGRADLADVLLSLQVSLRLRRSDLPGA